MKTASAGEHEVPQPQVGHGDSDGDCGDDQAVLGELPERDRRPQGSSTMEASSNRPSTAPAAAFARLSITPVLSMPDSSEKKAFSASVAPINSINTAPPSAAATRWIHSGGYGSVPSARQPSAPWHPGPPPAGQDRDQYFMIINDDHARRVLPGQQPNSSNDRRVRPHGRIRRNKIRSTQRNAPAVQSSARRAASASWMRR